MSSSGISVMISKGCAMCVGSRPGLVFIVLGIAEIKSKWWIPRERQLFFESKGRRYKARYNHELRFRGGIEIVEVGVGRGAPEIASVPIPYGLAYLLKFVRLKMMVRKCQRRHQLVISSWHRLALSAAVESAPFDFPAFETHCVCHQDFTLGR
jgi:hypothetical protein